MGKKDTIGALFWLILSLFILKEGWRLPFGTLSQPMPGFYPFILGIILGILSLILLGKSWLAHKDEGEDLSFFSDEKGRNRIILTTSAMLVFWLVLESVGFVIATFFLLSVLIKFIDPHKWIYSICVSGLISLCSYLLFQVLLKANLPHGIMRGLGF